jgi:hypothetical protein
VTYEDGRVNDTKAANALDREVGVDDTPGVRGLSHHRSRRRVENGRGDRAKVGVDGGIVHSGDELVSEAADDILRPGRRTEELDNGLEALTDDLYIDRGGEHVGVNKGLGENAW